MKHYLSLLIAIVLLAACEEKPVELITESQNSHTEALLQAISIIDSENIWLSGHKGTYVHSTDGGKTWQASVMPDADTLQFRDLHAFSNEEVVLMSAGPGKLSQIRKTSNGGKDWRVTYLMEDSTGFLNTIEFWDEQRGLAFGDAIAGALFVLQTRDGGETWERIDPAKLPAALGTEGGFAASGTCIATGSDGKAWIATGAGERPRIIYTPDYGESWQDISTPIVAGESAGITSVNFWDDQDGFIAGGDLNITDQYTRNVAFTINGGTVWSQAESPLMKGAVYGTGLVRFRDESYVFISGPQGINYSKDYGTTWDSLSTENYWAVNFAKQTGREAVGWATGTEGKILQIRLK